MGETVTDPQNETAAPTADTPAEPGPAGRGRRRTTALVAAAVAVAALAGGGVWAASAVSGADRTAPTAYWVPDGASLPDREKPGPVPANELSAKLLPAPLGFVPGPDLGADGNDYTVSGERALDGFKEARKGLSASDRKKRDEVLAGLKLKGLAGRSLAQNTGGLVVEVRLMQADPKALDSFAQISRKLLELVGKGNEAPAVDGFPDARCARVTVGEDEEEQNGKKGAIDSLSCVAVQGDVMVDFRAYGARGSFTSSDAVTIFKSQLNHLKSPGESV
ncbi:hypothetical protein ACFXPI_16975 [Streptomyces sp. NPDC059104]|uniref:hypothetical protein n=1 Tax=Streptomyces sp. NPDC059104 TaxID=3346729 RepID=UPI00368B47CF